MDDTVILTYEMLHHLKTPRGGFTAKTTSALGVKWPLKSGWLQSLVGNKMSRKQWEKACSTLQFARLPMSEYDLFQSRRDNPNYTSQELGWLREGARGQTDEQLTSYVEWYKVIQRQTPYYDPKRYDVAKVELERRDKMKSAGLS